MGELIERGQPVGTWSDKYTTRNAVADLLVSGFESTSGRLCSVSSVSSRARKRRQHLLRIVGRDTPQRRQTSPASFVWAWSVTQERRTASDRLTWSIQDCAPSARSAIE
jgi:hypothetical protein